MKKLKIILLVLIVLTVFINNSFAYEIVNDNAEKELDDELEENQPTASEINKLTNRLYSEIEKLKKDDSKLSDEEAAKKVLEDENIFSNKEITMMVNAHHIIEEES